MPNTNMTFKTGVIDPDSAEDPSERQESMMMTSNAKNSNAPSAATSRRNHNQTVAPMDSDKEPLAAGSAETAQG